MSLPPRASSFRTNSQSAPPPPKPDGNYSDRFKNRTTASVTSPEPVSTANASSYTDFPTLKRPVVMPNMVVMPSATPSAHPAISFAAKVKALIATEAAAKEKAAVEAKLREEEAKKNAYHKELYGSIFTRERVRSAPQEDSWEEEPGGTPEFGREEFLRFEDQEDFQEGCEEGTN